MSNKPFTILIKPASADCNLRCNYCFYLKKKELYPDSNHRMSEEVLEKLIAGYLSTQQPIYTFGWQGGEPSIMGLEFYKKVIALQEKYGKGKTVANSLQTNGTLLTDEFAAFLAQYKFLVGLSIDGPEEIHNNFRVRIDNSGSHSSVIKGMESLIRYGVDFNVLTLVNSGNVGRGKEVYRYLCDMGLQYHQYIPCVEFDENGRLLPFGITGEEWGGFLCDIFDEWVKRDTHRVSIRLFDSIIMHMMTGQYNECHMAGNCSQYFVVEHSGDVYPCDFFVTEDKRLGNIAHDSWEELQNSLAYNQFGQLKSQWNNACKACEYLTYCSGDCLKHRLYAGNPVDNISWLCSGWKKFFKHALPTLKELAVSLQQSSRIGNGGSRLFVDSKPDRNSLCYCGSMKKYKKCHGA